MPLETKNFVLKHVIDSTTKQSFTGDNQIYVKNFGGDWVSYAQITNLGALSAFFKFKLPDSYAKEWSAKVTARLTNREKKVFEQVIIQGNTRHVSHYFTIEQMGNQNNKNATIIFEHHVELTAHFPLREKKWDFSQGVKNISDVVLLVGEEKFHVSKAILATHSTYFYAMFFNNHFVESKQSEIRLVDVDPEMFQYLLEIIYHAPDVNEYNVESLLEMALMYDMKPVFTQCEQLLIRSTFFQTDQKVQFAEQYSFEELKNHLKTMTAEEALKNMDDQES